MALDIKPLKSIFKTSRTRGKGIGGDIKQKIIQEKSKEIFILPNDIEGLSIGNFNYVSVTSTGEELFTFLVPNDFRNLIDCKVVMIPDTTETVQWDIDISVAKVGEVHSADDRNNLDDTLAVVVNVVSEIDISAQLTNISNGDYIGIKLQSDTSSLRLIGLRFRYN